METNGIDVLYRLYHRKLQSTQTNFKRYLYHNINWSARLIRIKGARGVGKTTLIMQHIKETFANADTALYVSLDALWFKTHDIIALAEYADSHGVTHLFLDEVHHLKDWSLAIKNLYDFFPNLNIVYTSSSMLEMDNSVADLSRRQTLYYLPGLSFREYLEFEGVAEIPTVRLEDLLKSHSSIAMRITEDIKVLPLFEKYIKTGYYPFYKDAGEDYFMKLQEVIRTVIDVDMPSITDISFATIDKAKKLLMVLAENVPTVPKLSVLFGQIETTRDAGLKILNLLERADLLMLYSSRPKNYKNLTSPEKIFLHNTNLMYTLTASPNIGCVRETFFMNQLSVAHSVTMPSSGDFLIDGKYLFEVGGSGKTFKQIADLPDSFLAIDNIETSHASRIPLWMFGLLY